MSWGIGIPQIYCSYVFLAETISRLDDVWSKQVLTRVTTCRAQLEPELPTSRIIQILQECIGIQICPQTGEFLWNGSTHDDLAFFSFISTE